MTEPVPLTTYEPSDSRPPSDLAQVKGCGMGNLADAPPADLRHAPAHGCELRLRGHRRRLGGQRPRQPPQRRPHERGPGARGRASGLHLGRLHPHACGAAVPDRQPLLRLEVRIRTRAAHERAQDLPRPWQGPGRLQQHQRHDLPARQPAGLRTLGCRPGHGDLGLRALPAVLQAHGIVPGRRPQGRVPRPRRALGAGTRPGHEPAVRRLLRSGAAGGLRTDR